MNQKLQNTLLTKYPEFFEYLKGYSGPIIPIQFGFEVGDGWYWLLDNLMENIQNYCKWNNIPNIEVTQVKEKWGGLNFYYNGGNELISGMVWLAEHMSYKICEQCGTTENVGKTKGWVSVSCKDCHKKNNRLANLVWIPNENQRRKKLEKLIEKLNGNT
jgi:hypothetical protein